MGRLVNLLPLVFGLEHGPWRGDSGSRQQVSRAMAGGASWPEAVTPMVVRLLMTHFDWSTRGRATLSSILLECVTARLLLISVGSFAYLRRALRELSVFCLRGWMW